MIRLQLRFVVGISYIENLIDDAELSHQDSGIRIEDGSSFYPSTFVHVDALSIRGLLVPCLDIRCRERSLIDFPCCVLHGRHGSRDLEVGEYHICLFDIRIIHTVGVPDFFADRRKVIAVECLHYLHYMQKQLILLFSHFKNHGAPPLLY